MKPPLRARQTLNLVLASKSDLLAMVVLKDRS